MSRSKKKGNADDNRSVAKTGLSGKVLTDCYKGADSGSKRNDVYFMGSDSVLKCTTAFVRPVCDNARYLSRMIKYYLNDFEGLSSDTLRHMTY